MKAALACAAILLGGLMGTAQAQVVASLDGKNLTLPELMNECSSAETGSAAQMKCFEVLALALKEQEGQQAAPEDNDSAVIRALDSLRSAAEYQDAETGLKISGNSCAIQVLYYGNYYRISRRNVSTMDLFNVQFNASKMRYEETTQIKGQSITWFRGKMESGATAVSHGGAGLESSTHNFASKDASTAIDQYAVSVVGQLPAKEDQVFDFVLIHPQRQGSAAEIWRAFESFVLACRA